MRPCPTCGETDPTKFWKDKTRKNGLQNQCKACCKAKQNRWIAKPGSRDKVRLNWKNWWRRQLQREQQEEP